MTTRRSNPLPIAKLPARRRMSDAELFGEPERKPSPARDAAYAALREQAKRSARREIKDCARAYALRPRHLDAIAKGLSGCTPLALVFELAERLIAPLPNRYFGFGGEHPAINLRGAMLYARYARAKARQLARRAAA
jgi:hypothetical protein